MRNRFPARAHRRLMLIVTPLSGENHLPGFPWLAEMCDPDDTDWILLPRPAWRALAEGEPALWQDLERKLLINCYIDPPDAIAVIGHPDPAGDSSAESGPQEVHSIARRLADCCLGMQVRGYWVEGEDPAEPPSPRPLEWDEEFAV